VTLATPLDHALQMPYGRYNWPFVPFMLTAMIVFAPFSLLARALLDSFALRMLGMISYGVYIYHLPVQNATARYMKMLALNPVEHWVIFGAVSLMLTACVAALSYSVVELPLRRLVRRWIDGEVPDK
jgi:peptidoglycan/LPS O-acetylase OafA/YrhL